MGDLISSVSFEVQIIIASIFLVYILLNRYRTQQGSDVGKLKRAPDADWLWGNEQDAWAQTDGSFYIRNSNELGSAFAMKAALFHPDIVSFVFLSMLIHLMELKIAITDPAALTHMFTRHGYSYVKSQIIRPIIERLLGRSLLWAEGDEHKRQRQLLAPVFTHEQVKGMADQIYGATDKVVDALRAHLHNSPTSASLNIHDWTSRVTLDIIGSVGFGYDFKCGTSDEAKAIFAAWKRIVEEGITFPGFVAPLVIRAFPFIANLPVKAIQAQGEIKLLVRKLATEMVDARGGVEAEKGKDLLSALLRVQEVQGQALEQLLDHITTFVMVGHETTSATLGFTLWELARDKRLQDLLRQELLDFQGSGPGGEPTYEELQTKLPYLDGVCKEALRMYPPGSHTERIALKDDVLPLRFPVKTETGEEMTSIQIREGQLIYVSHIAIGRNAAVWGRDAEKFVPERWLDPFKLPASNTLSQGFSGLFSFLEGPRICIGYRLALFEYKVVLSALIRNFEFSDTGARIVTQFAVTMQPYIEGKKNDGCQLPLFVKDLHQ